MGVTYMIGLDVVFKHIEVTHLQGLFHHTVDILGTVGCGLDPGMDQPTQ